MIVGVLQEARQAGEVYTSATLMGKGITKGTLLVGI